jgi:hypothetical protein
MVEASLLHLVRTGDCQPICSSGAQHSCEADMRNFVDQGPTSSLKPDDRSLSLNARSRTLVSAIAALVVALLLLLLLAGIRMCALQPSHARETIGEVCLEHWAVLGALARER